MWLLTLFKIIKEYNNTRDYPTCSFHTGLLSIRHSPSLLLLTLGSNTNVWHCLITYTAHTYVWMCIAYVKILVIFWYNKLLTYLDYQNFTSLLLQCFMHTLRAYNNYECILCVDYSCTICIEIFHGRYVLIQFFLVFVLSPYWSTKINLQILGHVHHHLSLF